MSYLIVWIRKEYKDGIKYKFGEEGFWVNGVKKENYIVVGEVGSLGNEGEERI